MELLVVTQREPLMVSASLQPDRLLQNAQDVPDLRLQNVSHASMVLPHVSTIVMKHAPPVVQMAHVLHAKPVPLQQWY
jgi:hypothetical protein